MTFLFTALSLLLWTTNWRFTAACSCLKDPTIETTFEDKNTNAALKVMVGEEIFMEEDEFERRFAGRIQDPLRAKDCTFLSSLRRRRVEIRTASDSAMCGVELAENTSYLLVGSISEEDGTLVLFIDLCQYQRPWRSLPQSEINYLFNQRRCRCKPKKCGPKPLAPNYICPDGETVGGPSDICHYDVETNQCTWMQECPKCDSDWDCIFVLGEFCSKGVCRKAGTCSDLRDCLNPSNSYNIPIDCDYSLTCSENGQCEGVCGCGSCPASTCDGPCPCNPVSCFADPCTSNKCDVPATRCVSYYCGGCDALFYDEQGNSVCEP